MENNLYQTDSTLARPPQVTTQISEATEPRKLTFDETRQLLDIQFTPEDKRTDEQNEIWRVYQLRYQWECEQLKKQREQKEAQKQQMAKSASDEEMRYRQQLIAGQDKNSMEYFMFQLRQRTIPRQVVRVPGTTDQTYQYLFAAYQAEVQKNGCTFILDENTKRTLIDTSRWLATHSKSSLLLRGNVGVGKTTLLCAVRNVISIRMGENLQVWDARRIAALGKGKDGQQVLDELSKRPLLGIDDLGCEPLLVKDYGNDVTPLIELLTERYNKRLFTIITTNLAIVKKDGRDVDEIEERYGERIADRIREQYNTISYNADQKSYRR